MKSPAGFLQQILRDREIHQCRVDILVPQPGRQVMESLLRIDAFAVPRQHAVDHKGMPQIMDPRPPAALCRLETRLANDLG
jgi:hypothetical protein